MHRTIVPFYSILFFAKGNEAKREAGVMIADPCLCVNLNDDLRYPPIINSTRHCTQRVMEGALS